MDEYAWQSYGDPKSLLAHLLKTGQAKDRKLRLWACGCCRRLWGLLGQGCRDYVALAERVADGEAGEKELFSVAWDRAEAERNAERRPGRSAAAEAACYAGCPMAESAMEYAPQSARDAVAELAQAERLDARTVDQRRVAERLAQLGLLRCVFANPFRPVALVPSWQTEDVRSLAKGAYAERLPRGDLDPARLAVLGDALEEVGAAGDVLDHVRSPGPHVRGCWAIDLILGKQ